jgi:hypothetical protein
MRRGRPLIRCVSQLATAVLPAQLREICTLPAASEDLLMLLRCEAFRPRCHTQQAARSGHTIA